MALSHTAFNKLTIPEKYQFLQNEGDFICSRQSEGYFIHLFSLHEEYVELWMSAQLNHVMWIEILKNKETLRLYSEQFDPKKDLGL